MSRKIEFDLCEQTLTYTCGPTSLVMSYQGHGFNTSEAVIKAEMQLPDDGASWWHMRQHITSHGFDYVFKRAASFDELSLYQLPIVCYVTERVNDPDYHFSVVYQSDDISITLADPSFGDTVTYTREKFEQNWYDEEGKRTFLAITGYRSVSVSR